MPFYVIPAGLKLVGLTTIEEASKIPVKEYFFPEDQVFIIDEFFPRVIEQGRNEVEIRFRHFRSGAAIWMIYGVFALKNAEGALVGYATSSRDITERKGAEEALLEMDRRKDEFLAVLAHELRNPLAPIKTGLDVLRRTGLQGNSERMLEIMGRQISHLVGLVDDLLDISRISAGKITIRSERILLSDSIHEAIDMTRDLIAENELDLQLNLPEEPIYIDADLLRITQVFVNIITNAAKYTDKGGRIEISAEGTRLRCIRDCRRHGDRHFKRNAAKGLRRVYAGAAVAVPTSGRLRDWPCARPQDPGPSRRLHRSVQRRGGPRKSVRDLAAPI